MDEQEQGLAVKLQQTKAGLLAVLEVAGLPTDRHYEDTAREFALVSADAQAALTSYQAAVNALWLHAESTGLTEKLVRRWRGWRRKQVRESGIDAAEFSAEATFAIRSAITRFEPGRAPLVVFAQREVYAALDRYLGRGLTPVSLSHRQARKQKGSAYAAVEDPS